LYLLETEKRGERASIDYKIDLPCRFLYSFKHKQRQPLCGLPVPQQASSLVPEVIMRWIQTILCLSLLLFVQEASAGRTQIIELTDGSTITGEVVSLADGVYTIRSDSLGTVKVDAAKIRAIRSGSSSGAGAVSSDEVKALTAKIAGDSDIMAKILSLQNDPEFKKALEDPAIMKAVSEGDIPALTSNPKFMKLLDNATVKEIGEKVR
jgi:hypothetical protein